MKCLSSKFYYSMMKNAGARAELSGGALFYRLSRYINGEQPLANASEVLDEAVVILMDDKKFVGLTAWQKWIREIHRTARRRGQTLAVRFERVQQTGDIYTVSGRWLLSGVAADCEGTVRYRVRAGKIREIQTTKKNYIPIFGRRIVSPFYFWWVCCRIFVGNLTANHSHTSPREIL